MMVVFSDRYMMGFPIDKTGSALFLRQHVELRNTRRLEKRRWSLSYRIVCVVSKTSWNKPLAGPLRQKLLEKLCRRGVGPLNPRREKDTPYIL